MKSPRRAIALLILCLLPAAASAAEVPLSTSGWNGFSSLGDGVALLPGGGYAAVWSWSVVGGPYSDSDVRMQWVRPDGSRLFPKGYREVAASKGREEGAAVIAPHPRAGAFVAFSAGDSEVKTEVVVQRYDGAGRRLWPGIGVVAAVEQGRRIQVTPTLVPDAEGGVYVCFRSFSADGVAHTSKNLCQHLDATGRRRWTRYGLSTGGVHGLRGAPHGVTDGQGGLLVVWRNERTLVDPRPPALIEGQRFAPDGKRLWGPQGRLLQETRMPGRGATFSGSEALRVESDGAGGALLAFDDLVSESEAGSDVVAQRIDRDGRPLWGSGAVVADEPGLQTVVDLVPGPGGGAFVLSQDRQERAALGVHRLDATGGTLWQTQISGPEADDTSGFLAFDGDLLRAVWTRQVPSGPSQVRMLVLDLSGNRLNGSDGEVLAEKSSYSELGGFVYDLARDQGFAVQIFGTSRDKAVGVLVEP